MKMAYYCLDNPEHIFKGRNLDGVRCPYCDGLVITKTVSNEEYERLPKYRELKKIIKPKKPLGIEVQLEMDNGKLQRKLKAISKHAGALAEELEAIDKE